MADTADRRVIDVDSANFQTEVIERSASLPVVVDFWAQWCAPCRALGPLLERLAAEASGGFLLAKVNVDEAPEIAERYGVRSIPSVKAFREGGIVDEFAGLLPESRIREFLRGIAPGEADEALRRARELEASDPAAAETAYREALELDPALDAARLGLARLLLARGESGQARELTDGLVVSEELRDELRAITAALFLRRVAKEAGETSALRERVEREPENAVALYRLGCALAGAGSHEEALEILLRAATRDRELAREKIREVMVEIFYAIGARSPLADDYRSRLSRVLY